MRRIVLGLSIAVLAATPAFAAEDILAGFYGNTVVSTGGMLEVHTHYKPDHTFDFSASMSLISRSGTGTWKIDASGQLCRDIKDPPTGVTNPSCSPIAPHKVGDTWTMTQKDGSTRTLTLKSGIQ